MFESNIYRVKVIKVSEQSTAENLAEKPIYLDYSATTPIDQRVVTEMLKYMGPKVVLVTLHHAAIVLAGQLKPLLKQHVNILQTW